jgi:sulfur transfer complex TusBCD TusB component (DsrH family)
MSAGRSPPVELVETAKGDPPVLHEEVSTPAQDGIINLKDGSIAIASNSDTEETLRGPNGEVYPSKKDLETLRRVKGHISPIIYTIAFIELCERFAYYGTTAVCRLSASHINLKLEYVLSTCSRQLHPTTSPTRVDHRCFRNVWPTWCARQGPTSFYRSRDIQ